LEWKNPTDYSHVGKQRECLISLKKGAVTKEHAMIMAESELNIAKNLVDGYATAPKFETKYEMISESRRMVERSIEEEILRRNFGR
jgi:hypothetical protein